MKYQNRVEICVWGEANDGLSREKGPFWSPDHQRTSEYCKLKLTSGHMKLCQRHPDRRTAGFAKDQYFCNSDPSLYSIGR